MSTVVLKIPENPMLSFSAPEVPPGGMWSRSACHSHPPFRLTPPASPLSENTTDPLPHTPAVLVFLSPTQIGQIEVLMNIK